MSLVTAQAQVDTWWTTFRSILETVQADYLGGNPVYFSAVWSHTEGSIPNLKDSGQGEVTPDNMTVENQDGSSNSSVGVVILTPIPCRFKQDEYQTPTEIGIQVVLSFIYFGDGLEYYRVENMYGPIIWPDTAWAVVEE